MNKKTINFIFLSLLSSFYIKAMHHHSTIQQQFLALQQKAGIPLMQTERQRISKLRPGPQGTQAQFNAVRSNLNNLLSKDALTLADIRSIYQNIIQLDSWNPARWPRPSDYMNLLAKKIGITPSLLRHYIATARSPITKLAIDMYSLSQNLNQLDGMIR